jgi:acyl-CoA reductase-like NAD-dependent aldehyde dehydrogenase
MQNYKMLIGGKWVEAITGKTFSAYNPATEEVIAKVPLAGQADIDKAVEAAQKAALVWAKKTPAERSDMLYHVVEIIESNAKELVEVEIISHGTPVNAARGSVGGISQLFKYAAQVSRSFMGQVIPTSRKDKLFYLQYEPRGVCALIVAWSSPIISTSKKLSAALATGNTCVIKPPSASCLSILKLAEILEKAGLPPGTINVITGPGGSVGESLAAHSGIDMISFTGSCETGKRIMSVASKTVKPLQLELGGKNPCIMFEDIDIDTAVAKSLPASFNNTGMVCACIGRYYLHEKIYDEFVNKFIAGAQKIVVGDPGDEKTTMGPVVSAEHRDRVYSFVQSGIDEGAKLALGGKRFADPPLNKGYFVMPTVFTNVTQQMKIAREEIFGPIACFLKFSSKDDLISLANDTKTGLCASIWTKNTSKALSMANEIHAGTIWINDHLVLPIEIPWGGFKESGFGKENSVMGLEEYIRYKLISI